MADGSDGHYREQEQRTEASLLRERYWRRVQELTLGLLAGWGGVTLAACWFAEALNRLQLGRFPFGFWLSAQGAILVYVLLIAVYAWVMDRWDAALASALAAASAHG